ncbi:MAG: serine hydrolase [Ardenticatenaceae bacterium]|nr:serine hydrolase [Anaerolineales bacterium]MCB8940358.1 serine hydrolase [Ardenticatenaceae bacterium]MCB8973374.1 serine hydrolase [Ardenticatenaceae bacterium]
MCTRNANKLFNFFKTAVSINQRLNIVRLMSVLIALLLLAGCGPTTAELEEVDYAPQANSDWPTSTPNEEGIDPKLVAELYYNASQMENIYSLLLFKNGYLVAEDYFNIGSPTQQVNIHSVTKSINSALVGLALEEGCLTSLDQKMMGFFPELETRIRDPRKRDITIRQMLQMRAGYPWEEASPEGTELLFGGFHEADLVNVPLVRDPGSDAEYSNLTSHLLGIIVARACETDLKTFADEHLFAPLGIEEGFWQVDWDGNYLGFSDIDLSAHDLAKFGLLYLNEGEYNGVQIIPAEWVHDSLQIYSEDVWKYRVGRNWDDNAYGYQWWSIRAGDHRYNLAWGHGGQQIVLLDALDMMIVVTVDPLHLQHGDEPWQLEKASLNLVANFIADLPSE